MKLSLNKMPLIIRGVPLTVSIRYILLSLTFGFGFLAAYGFLATIPGFVGTDDYYHSRIAAQIIEQRRLQVDFPWLPLTILGEQQFVDHHLLYHMYLAPWMHWGGIMGVKIAQSIIMGGIAVTFWALLHYLQVRFALIWALGIMAISSPFLYRMLMIRTQAAAVLFLLWMLHLLFRERYRWLVPLAFAFTWLYNGFILMPIIAAIYVLSIWFTQHRFVWQPIVYVILGMVLGLTINPYFPQNTAFILDHLGEKVDIAGSVRVGSEWYPYDTVQLLDHSLGAFLALGIGLLAGTFRKVGRDYIETTLLLIALLTLFMLFQSRRFIEYFPIFALLFCAVAWGRGSIQWQQLRPSFLPARVLSGLLVLGFAGATCYLGYGVLQDTQEDIHDAKDFAYMADASAWLQQHTAPGEIVFQTDWDDFTRLFYHNTHNVYLVGLDPTYLQVADPFLWNQWVAITQGLVDRPSVLIQESFGAAYVVSDTHHSDFAEKAEGDPNMQLVYRDEYSLIWRIGEANE